MSFPLVKSLLEKEQDADNKGKKKKGKAKAGPERKKPCPTYVLWMKDQWTEAKKENPEADFKEVSNTLGAKWKALSAAAAPRRSSPTRSGTSRRRRPTCRWLARRSARPRP